MFVQITVITYRAAHLCSRVCLTGLICIIPFVSSGQREGDFWAFGDHGGLDFSSGTPVAVRTAMDNQFCGNASVSSAAGSLLFYTDGNRVWNRNHTLMPNGVLLTTSFGSSSAGTWAVNQAAVIVPVPGDTDLYYIFSMEIYTGGYRLWYSVVDMRLDNGMGDIAQRPVLHDPGPLTEAMTVVRGEQCNYWLLVHEKFTDQFRAYEINAAGVSPVPSVSHAGTLGAAIFSFSNYHIGGMKISSDRRRLAGNWALSGLADYYLEVYDFDPMTGRVSNAVRLDGPRMYYYNTCFSPDNSKLYATGNGYLHQFDLSLPNTAAIIASKTDLFSGRFIVTHGDLKRGPDGKMYLILRGTNAIHQINFPNLAGMACGVVPYAFPLVAGTDANWGLPNENMVALPPEQMITSTRFVGMCTRDSLLLAADTPGINYVWNTQERTSRILVRAPGTYTVRYTEDCTHHLDTFIVLPYPDYPSVYNNGFSCAGQKEGMARAIPAPGDTTRFTYTWMDGGGQVIRTASGRYGDTLDQLEPGDYRVRVSTDFGCDNLYAFTILPLPLPEVRFEAPDKICEQEPLRFRNHSGEGLDFTWNFGDGALSRERDPEHAFRTAGTYTVVLRAENSNGCRDSFTRAVHVGRKDFLRIGADRIYADQGQRVLLRTAADDDYRMLAWLPDYYFPDISAYTQQVRLDSTQEFTAVAESEYGCVDSASVTVYMNPVLFIPTAFTPDGDGINDYFRPVAKGDIGTVRYLMIYNRWGEQVWMAAGAEALRGWDGTHGGVPAEAGVYYYLTELETPSGRQYAYKGEITLIR